MGMDVPDIHTAVHWGPPNDIESYVQETGRGGRDGQFTKAILYYNKSDLKSRHVNEAMRIYCIDITQCRRQQLMKQFCEFVHVETPSMMHLCCDVCAKECKCETSTIDVSLLPEEVLEEFEKGSDIEYSDTELLSTNYSLSSRQKKCLRDKLLQLRRDIIISEPASILVGAEILSGLTKTTIDVIVDNCTNIHNVDDLQKLGVTSFEFATTVYQIIKSEKK